ncbi:ATP-binding cassette domain-containing protein, partial [Gammaproteobacteria bacterium]|nr:ATP-binding cassette domain-containing protein [Gammaproteobacteria bacterium]
IQGHNLATMSASARDRLRADSIGLIFQQFNLLPWLSIIDNVTLPCRFSQPRAERATLTSATLADEAARLLQHLLPEITDLNGARVGQLSVGQQQRVAAARALIGKPSLIVADEPTSSLDHNRRHAFMSLLFDEIEASGSTLVFVSHDPELKRHFKHQLALGASS